MKQTFSPSEAALSIFELTKRQPQFVLKFCIAYAIFLTLTYAIAGATGLGKVMADYMALAAGGRTPDPERVLEVLSPGTTGLVVFASFTLVTGALTSAMGLRKALRDEEAGLLGLQFGKDEINFLLASVVFGAILVGINVLVSLIGGIVSGGNLGLMFLIVAVSVFVVAIAGIRLSQFGVITMMEGRVSIANWLAQTKGQSTRFLGAYLLWGVVSAIIAILAQAVAGIGASAMGVKTAGGMPESLAAFLKPGWLFYTLIYGMASGFGTLGALCIGAYAWHQMRGDLPAPSPQA